MTKRMLVDATHSEEVRVAILQDQRLINLEIETSGKEQNKGNIYLGRVTRVEPSLQAAFVDYNGGRQGFLSANDIHVKYYPPLEADEKEVVMPPLPEPEEGEGEGEPLSEDDGGDDDEDEDGLHPEVRSMPRRRFLPIQKILTRNQVLLVQVVKEARGGKGASLTTNISLAGRYTVLLPENSGGGGISRKIVDVEERKNLKEILNSLEIPEHISLIIRTAGLGRNKREISRDMTYLLRLWKVIQDKAATMVPPVMIQEEGDLIIRTLRDLYSTDMEEVLIEGQEAYRRGKDFMRLLMPSYVKVVQPYRDRVSLFARYQVDDQIESMHERMVRLRSGGYLVVDTTEALVAIDINSGRSTREKNVENTAYKTNMEAADEIARQLRLRDLGGLIVIDFIDMEDKRHNLDVEKRLKDALKQDRAKIQMGKISQFGLLELSRQRLRPAFTETNRQECPRCHGVGNIRSVESSAIHVYRRLVEDALSGKYQALTYQTPVDVAFFLLNNKRGQIADLEQENQLTIIVQGMAEMQTPDFKRIRLERTGKDVRGARPIPEEVVIEEVDDLPPFVEEEGEEEGEKESPLQEVAVATGETVPEEGQPATGETPTRRRRRRRRRRPGTQVAGSSAPADDNTDGESGEPGEEAAEVAAVPAVDTSEPAPPGEGEESGERPRSRRPRRRRRRPASANRLVTGEGAGESSEDPSPADPPRDREPVHGPEESAS